MLVNATPCLASAVGKMQSNMSCGNCGGQSRENVL